MLLIMKIYKLIDTSTCFLKEYKTHKYFRLSISKVNNENISKGIPIIFNEVKNNLSSEYYGINSFPLI